MICGIGDARPICQALLIAAVAAVVAASAYAQQQPIQPFQPPSGVTITTSSATAVPAGSYIFVSLFNQSSTATIRCNWGGAAVSADTAGQYTLLPYSGYNWDANDPPPVNKALNCISSAVSTPATVRAY